MEFQLEEVAQTLWDCYRKRSDEIDNSCSLLSMVLHRALDWLHDEGLRNLHWCSIRKLSIYAN